MTSWQHIDWPRYQRIVDTEYGPVHTVDYGSGDPMIFIHGLSGRWQNWLPNIAHFSQTHRVIAMDLPGFGHSPAPTNQRISMDYYVQAVIALCKQLHIKNTTVIGNSMGGLIATELSVHHKKLVDGLVLVSPAGISTERFTSNITTTLLRTASSVTGIYGRWVATHAERIASRPRLRKLALAAVSFDGSTLTPELVVQQLRGAGTPGFLDAALAVLTHSVRNQLAQVHAPTLIVWGEHDRLIPVSDATIFEAGIPNAELKIYEKTGHMAMLERSQRFHNDVEAFLEQASQHAIRSSEALTGDLGSSD